MHCTKINRQMLHQMLFQILHQILRYMHNRCSTRCSDWCSNRRRERLTILRYTHTEEERSSKYCFANHIYFCSCFCSVLCSCLLLQPLSSFTCLLQCNDPEFCILWDLSQKIMSYRHATIQFYNGRTSVYWLLSLIMQKKATLIRMNRMHGLCQQSWNYTMLLSARLLPNGY